MTGPDRKNRENRIAGAALILLLLSSGSTGAQEEDKPSKDTVAWALDDTDKVHPVTGNLLSQGKDLYTGKLTGPGEHRTSNSVWNAASRTVKLFAGRNEFVSFQVVLEKGKDDLHKIFVNATDLLGANARISADSHIKLFKQLYVQLDGVWYPDALVPFDIAGVTPMELPDPASGVPGQRAQSVWIDVYVPHTLPPGSYTGQIIVLHRNTNKQAILNVELEVAPFTLPDEVGLEIDLMNYGFLNIERGWPDMVIDGPRHRAIEREFFRSAHEHRMTFAVVPYNHDGSIPKGVKPELAGTGADVRVADWSSWDARFGPLLSGEAFADLPRGRQPVGHFFLPYNLMWPSDMRHWKKADYRTEHLRVSEQLRKHLAAKGWTKPQYQIYYNHKEHYQFFPWNLDEPTRPEDLDALRYLGEILKESFPANDPVRVLYRLDIGHFHCENVESCTHKRETGAKAVSVLNPFVGLWNVNSAHYYGNLAEGRKLKAQGKTVYFYTGTPHVAEPLVESAFWGWRGYRFEVDGICYWNATDWGDWDTDAPPADPYTNAGGRYKGFSMLFYPGAKFGYDGPVPSIRLKTMRRGFQDFEYLRLIEKNGAKSRPALAAMADEFLKSDGADYPKLRRALFELLSRR